MNAEFARLALAEVVEALDVPASFDLDCSAHPCLAAFSSPVPTAAQRTVIEDRLVDRVPAGALTSATFVDEHGRETWVLVLADAALSDEEAAGVRGRMDELLSMTDQESGH